MSKRLTPAEVRYLFSYANGVLYWLVRPSQNVRIGAPAGTPGNVGHRGHAIRYQGCTYQRTLLVWAWHRGEWPVGNVRHVDGDSQNDAIDNLRDETDPEFLQATPAPGVMRYSTETGDRYRVNASASFDSLAIAEAAAKAARRALVEAAL